MFRIKSKKRDTSFDDRSIYRPVIKASICNRERSVGFLRIEDNHYFEIMKVESDKEIDEFKRLYSVERCDIIY